MAIPQANAILRRAMSLATSFPDEALACLEAGIRDLTAANDRQGVGVLARHAGAICCGNGALSEAKAFYRLALEVEPDDPALSLAQGMVCVSLGDWAEARGLFHQSISVAVPLRQEDVAEMARNRLANLGTRGE